MTAVTFDINFIHVTVGRVGSLVVSVSAINAVGHWFAPQSGHIKDHHKNATNMHALGKEFDSAARLFKR